MRLHLADASHDKGQFDLLAREGYLNTLVSYHYMLVPRDRKNFTKLWEEQLRLHFVIDSGANAGMQQVAVDNDGTPNRLYSYHYEKAKKTRYSTPDLRPRVLIDSGAFTAFTSGKPINPIDYGSWALKFAVRWRDKLADLNFINLDVIGNQHGTWKNQEILEAMGLHPLPVVTYGADLKNLTYALERYEYICLGGLVPISQKREKMRAWLDYCFNEVMRYKKEEGKLRKIHLLGVTKPWVLNRYPCFSSDSSAWTQALRFNRGHRAGFKQRLPHYTLGESQLATHLHTLRTEIRHYRKMEEDATRLWAARGITFQEDLCHTA